MGGEAGALLLDCGGGWAVTRWFFDNLSALEYQVLVTNLTEELLAVSDRYRQRADAENVYDELKNQWGGGGFILNPAVELPKTEGHPLFEGVQMPELG